MTLATAPARTTPTTRTARVLVVGAAAAALVLVPVAAASAHVRVQADTTAAGGYAELTFRVPNESASAGTTALSVDLPTDTPISSISTLPVAGWTAVVTEGDLPAPVDVDGTTLTRAPLTVTWTADPGTQIAPGQFQEFTVLGGPLPAEGTELVMPAHQTYSDGSVVDWDEVAAAGAEEPESPAPSLLVTAAGADEHAGHDASGEAMTGDAVADGTTTDGTTTSTAGDAYSSSLTLQGASDTTARWLGGAGLALGAAALVVTLLRRRGTAG